MQIPPQQTRLGKTFDVVSPRFLQAAHHYDTAVHLWTINEQKTMRRYVDMGIDGIIIDYPNRALKLLGRLSEGLANAM